ncbi:ATP-binding protein [Pantoea dispersa]|uniref:ATP-binding protein n=1 Tax=Pantoea TaxID=53335 RepID=UPI0010A93870|nr:MULTISPECIES: ATP-binding protein [Pantoea]THD40256.1 ATP-binding protein [Pantoea sp. R102]UKY37698.1 ATP-binding protein [Pantoea dispersa]
MDRVTARRFGQPVVINGRAMCAAEHAFTADMGPLCGEGLLLIVFDRAYEPGRHDRVEWQTKRWRVTRWQLYNNKPQIWLEEENDAGTEAGNDEPA